MFAYLSLLTVGGGLAAFPELKTLVVSVHHWMDFDALIHLYSVGQLAPRARSGMRSALSWLSQAMMRLCTA